MTIPWVFVNVYMGIISQNSQLKMNSGAARQPVTVVQLNWFMVKLQR